MHKFRNARSRPENEHLNCGKLLTGEHLPAAPNVLVPRH